MQQHLTARFELTEKEVREALYNYFVRKFKDYDVNGVFTPEEIDLGDNPPYVTLEIKQTSKL